MIDGIVSGSLLLKPKPMFTARGSQYVIAKMQVYGYRYTDTITGDVIAFDATVCRLLMDMERGASLSVCGIITPVQERGDAGNETILKITAKMLIDGYVSGQSTDKGALFHWLQ